VLAVPVDRSEARARETVFDETVADRLDTIVYREEQCPDCFDPEAGVCSLIEAEVGSEPAP
jgi:Mn-dependent DtxR family transcriptional regulator